MFKHISIYLLIVCLFKEEAVLKEAEVESYWQLWNRKISFDLHPRSVLSYYLRKGLRRSTNTSHTEMESIMRV